MLAARLTRPNNLAATIRNTYTHRAGHNSQPHTHTPRHSAPSNTTVKKVTTGYLDVFCQMGRQSCSLKHGSCNCEGRLQTAQERRVQQGDADNTCE